MKTTVPLLMATLVIAGCATHVKTPVSASNPAPAEAFSKFTAFELKPINTSEGCDKQHGADVALRMIQEKLEVQMGGVIKRWSQDVRPAQARRVLVIEPVCSDAKLVGGAARFWGGALAGSSAVVMKVRYTEAGTGKVIAEPVFYQRAAAMGAAWTFGATDRGMIDRVVRLMTDYAEKNYQAAVGGSTGL